MHGGCPIGLVESSLKMPNVSVLVRRATAPTISSQYLGVTFGGFGEEHDMMESSNRPIEQSSLNQGHRQ